MFLNKKNIYARNRKALIFKIIRILITKEVSVFIIFTDDTYPQLKAN